MKTRKQRGGGLTKSQGRVLKRTLTNLNPERRKDVYIDVYELIDEVNKRAKKDIQRIYSIQNIKEYVQDKLTPENESWNIRNNRYIRYVKPRWSNRHRNTNTRRNSR